MNKTFLRDLLTGATALVGLVGLILTLMLIGEIGSVVQRYYVLKVNVTNAAGISETSPVTLNGVRVGQVMRAQVLASPAVGAELTLRVRAEVKVPKVVQVGVSQGLVGDGALELSVPPTATVAQLADVYAEDDVIQGGTPQTLIGQIAGIVKEPFDRFARTADNIDALAAEYTKLGQRLNEMLEPRTLADVQAGKPANLRTTLERLDNAVASAQVWLSDEAFRNEAKETVARARKLMDEGAALMETWKKTGESADKAASSVQSAADEARQRIGALADEAVVGLRHIDRAATELTVALEGVNQGQGTLGQLATNPDLYNDLRSAARRLDKVLEEFQLLVEKVKAEGLKVGL